MCNRFSPNIHHLFLPRVWIAYGKAGLYYKGTQVWDALDASYVYTAAILE